MTTAPVRFSKLKMLSPDTRNAIDTVAVPVQVPAGTVLLTEGERSNDLLIIESGQAAGTGTGKGDGEEWRLIDLGPGDMVGEDAFLDASMGQLLTVRAETDCSLIKINPFDLIALEDGDQYYDNLRASLGIIVVQRLRAGTDVHLVTLSRQLEASRIQHQFGQFFLYTLAMFSIGMFANHAISTNLLEVDIRSEEFSWKYLVALLVPSFLVIRIMRVSLHDIGLTTWNLRKSLIEGSVVSLALVALTAALVIVSSLSASLPDLKVEFDPPGLALYFAHSFLQELVARGFMLNSFQKFLGDTRGVKSIIVSGTLFGVGHIHFGLEAVVMTFFSCLVFGYFYLRHHNIAGVTLLHFTLGACAFASGLL